MAKCFINVKDEVTCFISGLQPSHLELLWKEFGIYADGYMWMPMFKLGRWDGKVRFFEKTGKTYVRLLERIVPFLERWGYDLELVDNRKAFAPPEFKATVTSRDSLGIALTAECGLFADIEINGKPFGLRPYQVDCVLECIEAGSGIVLGGTGMGKTSVTAAISHIYSSAGYKTITIVPSADLVTQTAEWYDLLKMDVGVYSGSEKDVGHLNVVATWQAVQWNPAILDDFMCVIWDESHGAKSTVAQKLLNESGKHIPFRFGVTGTLPKPPADLMSIHTTLGHVLKEIPASWLMKHEYLSKVEIQPIELNEVYIDENFPDYASEKSFLSKSPARLEIIADLIITQAANYGNTLVLVNSIPFGEKLAALIKDAVFLYGASPKDLRKEHYDMFEQRDDIIVIASAGIASTGISIDRVFCLCMVDAGKSFIKAIQSIGRSLRKGKDKDSAFVVDIHSKQKWAKKHHGERLKHYKECGYPVNVKQTLKVSN